MAWSQYSCPRLNQKLTAVVFHVCPDVPLLKTVGKRAVPNIVALLLLHHVHAHLGEICKAKIQVCELQKRLCPEAKPVSWILHVRGGGAERGWSKHELKRKEKQRNSRHIAVDRCGRREEAEQQPTSSSQMTLPATPGVLSSSWRNREQTWEP